MNRQFASLCRVAAVALIAVGGAVPVLVQAQPPSEAGQPSNFEQVVRAYYLRVADQVDAYGGKHFPKKNGKSVYGRVIVRLTIASTGKVKKVEVLASPSATLTKHSLAVLRAAGPFEPFPSEMAAQVDVAVIKTSLNYTRDE